MTHYQKLATLIFRVIGCSFFVLAAIAFLLCLTVPFFGFQNKMILLFLIFYPLPLAILGAVFWLLSKRLAKFVTVDLDNINE
jgi:hypothetical protein